MQSKLPCADYVSPAGRAPVREFIASLPPTDRDTVIAAIGGAKKRWPRVDGKHIKKVEQGLWEVRTNITNGIARVLFMSYDGQPVMLHGLVKKTPRLTERDKATARARRVDVLGFGE